MRDHIRLHDQRMHAAFDPVDRSTFQGQATITRQGFSINSLPQNLRDKFSIVFSKNIQLNSREMRPTLGQAGLQPTGCG